MSFNFIFPKVLEYTIKYVFPVVSLFISASAYFISKKNYSIHFPYLVKIKELNITSLFHVPYFKYEITFKNVGEGNLLWGVLYLINKSDNTVYTSQPILNLKNNNFVYIVICCYSQNKKTGPFNLFSKLLQKISNKKGASFNYFSKYTSFEHNVYPVIFYVDNFNNKFFFKPSKHDLINSPSSPKRITLLNTLYYKIKKWHLTRIAIKRKTTFELFTETPEWKFYKDSLTPSNLKYETKQITEEEAYKD